MRKLPLLCLPVAAALGFAVLVAPVELPDASAAPASTIADSPVDEVIDSAVGPDGTIYAVGGFDEVGAATGGLARLSSSTAQVDRSFLTVNGRIATMVTAPSGAIYLGGDFVSVNGQPRQDLARLNPDGSLDETWAPVVTANNSYIQAMVLDDTTLFVGGNFSGVAGQSRTNLAAVTTTTGQALAWTPAPNFPVTALAADDTSLYVGGAFTTPRQGLMSFSLADLSLRSGWNSAGANSQVSGLAVGNGLVYVSGYYNSIAGVSRNGLAALSASTGAATSWNPAVGGGSVDTITMDDSIVYIGGSFTSVNGGSVTRNRAAALNTDDTGTARPWNPNVAPCCTVSALTVSASTVYIGGNFVGVGGTTMQNLARVDKNLGALDSSWNAHVPTAGGMFVQKIVDQGSQVLIGGSFTHVNAVERPGAAAFDGNGRVTSWSPNIVNGTGYAIELSGSTAYVVGDFNTVNGSVARDYAAAFRTDDSGTVTPWDPQLDSYPYDMVIDGNLAYIVGDFTDIGGSTRNYAAAVRIDDAGTATPWDPDLDSAAYSIALDGDVAYLAGDFNNVNQGAGGVSRYTAAAVRTDDTGTVTPWDPAPDSNAYGVTVANGIVYLVGGFQFVKDGTSSRVMRYGAAAFTTDDSGTVTDWDPYVDGGTPYDIEIAGDYAYLGGDFSNVNGGAVDARGLVSLSIDDTGTAAPDWAPVASGTFEYGSAYEGGLSVINGRLAVMGSFKMATLNGADYPGALALLPIPGSPVPPTPAPTVGTAPSAPRDVTVKPGNARVTVAWEQPQSVGSFPVTHYRVTAQPGGQTCLTNERTCTLTGLTNGREYAVTVAALNGAGWGTASDPVYATPGDAAAAIQITGSREGRMIRISGASTELGMGAILNPWTRRPGGAFTQGSAAILVSMDGTFTWQRKSNSRISVYVETPDGSLRSNTLVIPAR